MTGDPDIAAFDRRAASYDDGRLGAWHARIIQRVADLALSVAPQPTRSVLDVGCGTGRLLDLLAPRLGPGVELLGIDPAPGMVEQASLRSAGRFEVKQASAEALPVTGGRVDLVICCLSFDHWADQAAGLRECARVLRPGGVIVVADLFAAWLALAAVARRRGRRARVPQVMEALCDDAGLEPLLWQQVERLGFLPVVQAIVARR